MTINRVFTKRPVVMEEVEDSLELLTREELLELVRWMVKADEEKK